MMLSLWHSFCLPRFAPPSPSLGLMHMDQRSVRDILAGKTYFIRTFGCQMNQHDSERVSGLLDSYGCLMALDPEHADIVVFMTCCVREAADTRLYGQCNSCKSLPPSPSGKRVVAVGGCIAQRDGEGLLTNVDNVNVIFGTHSIAHVAELIAEAFLDGKRHIRTNEHEDTDAMSMPWHRETQYHAWVPIMTGCNNFCTYCIVPYTRGRERSRDVESILNEIRDMRDKGFKEATLLGQNVNSYAFEKDGETVTFPMLLERVALEAPNMRIRFVTSHPKDMSDDTLRVIAAHNNICKYIHLPAQSGSSKILKVMNRKYTREWYLDRIAAIRRIVPEASIATDLFCGFHSETEEDYQETLSLMREVRYDAAFLFKYSERPGTYAAKHLPDTVSEEEKVRRLQGMIDLQNQLSEESNLRDIGKEFEVLIEGFSKRSREQLFGRTSQNKVVIFDKKNYKVGQFVKVRINRASSATLFGETID